MERTAAHCKLFKAQPPMADRLLRELEGSGTQPLSWRWFHDNAPTAAPQRLCSDQNAPVGDPFPKQTPNECLKNCHESTAGMGSPGVWLGGHFDVGNAGDVHATQKKKGLLISEQDVNCMTLAPAQIEAGCSAAKSNAHNSRNHKQNTVRTQQVRGRYCRHASILLQRTSKRRIPNACREISGVFPPQVPQSSNLSGFRVAIALATPNTFQDSETWA